jgi:hypothetical protein
MKQTPTTNKATERGDKAVEIAILEHARAMALNASKIRQQNFNFFLILTGALVAASMQVNLVWKAQGIGVAGCVVSLLFIGLDVRGRRLLNVAQCQLMEIEKQLGFSMQREAVLITSQRWFWRVMTHTWIYRTMFISAAIAFGLIAAWPPGARSERITAHGVRVSCLAGF